MSFGFSISDFLALTQLASNVVGNTRKACGTHDELTREVTNLSNVLNRLAELVQQPDSVFNRDARGRWRELTNLSRECRKILEVLAKVLDKYNVLADDDMGGVSKLWSKIKFGNGEMLDLGELRLKLVTSTTALTIFLNLISLSSQGRVETLLESQGNDVKEISQSLRWIMASMQSRTLERSVLTSYSGDDKAFWKELRRELIMEGYSSTAIRRHKRLIKEYVMELGSRGVLDDFEKLGQGDDSITLEEQSTLDSHVEILGSQDNVSSNQEDENGAISDEIGNSSEDERVEDRTTIEVTTMDTTSASVVDGDLLALAVNLEETLGNGSKHLLEPKPKNVVTSAADEAVFEKEIRGQIGKVEEPVDSVRADSLDQQAAVAGSMEASSIPEHPIDKKVRLDQVNYLTGHDAMLEKFRQNGNTGARPLDSREHIRHPSKPNPARMNAEDALSENFRDAFHECYDGHKEKSDTNWKTRYRNYLEVSARRASGPFSQSRTCDQIWAGVCEASPVVFQLCGTSFNIPSLCKWMSSVAFRLFRAHSTYNGNSSLRVRSSAVCLCELLCRLEIYRMRIDACLADADVPPSTANQFEKFSTKCFLLYKALQTFIELGVQAMLQMKYERAEKNSMTLPNGGTTLNYEASLRRWKKQPLETLSTQSLFDLIYALLNSSEKTPSVCYLLLQMISLISDFKSCEDTVLRHEKNASRIERQLTQKSPISETQTAEVITPNPDKDVRETLRKFHISNVALTAALDRIMSPKYLDQFKRFDIHIGCIWLTDILRFRDRNLISLYQAGERFETAMTPLAKHSHKLSQPSPKGAMNYVWNSWTEIERKIANP